MSTTTQVLNKQNETCHPPVISQGTFYMLTLVGLIPFLLLILLLFNETSNNKSKNAVRWSIIPYFFICTVAFVMLLFMTFITYYDFSNVEKVPWYLLIAPLLIMLGVFLGGGYCIGPFKPNCN
jgi:hypothetical protein